MMPFPRGLVPLHWITNTFPPFLGTNKDCLFGGFSYLEWYIKLSFYVFLRLKQKFGFIKHVDKG